MGTCLGVGNFWKGQEPYLSTGSSGNGWWLCFKWVLVGGYCSSGHWLVLMV